MRHAVEIIILALLAASQVQAKQVISVQTDETVSVTLAESTYNRLFIRGERIQSVRGLQNNYDLEKDEQNGEIYIRIKEDHLDEPLSLFLTTELAHHYHVLLTTETVAEPVIELVPEMRSEKPTETVEKSAQADPLQSLMDFVVMGLHPGKSEKLTSTVIQNPTQQYLYDSFVLIPQKKLSHEDYQGVLYSVTNRSEEIHSLRADFFYAEEVVAVGLKEMLLPPKTSTQVLVVSHPQKNKGGHHEVAR